MKLYLAYCTFLYCSVQSLHYDPRIPGISEELTLATLAEFIADAEQVVNLHITSR